MKQFGKLFNRPAYLLVIVMLVVGAALPTSASAMLALETLDFNTCGLPGGWTFENPNSFAGATASIQGAYTGESYLQMNIGQGEYATISDSNFNAPRLMTTISDASFTVEAKFLAPQIASTGYKIEGLIFRQNTDPTNIKWLRIDFDSTGGNIYHYITYLRSNGRAYINDSQDDIVSVNTPLEGGTTTTGPILIRVQYNQATGAWTVTYTMNGENTVVSFNKSDFDATFAPNGAGLFVANSSAAPAHQTRVDYFHVIGTTLDDDATKLTVNTVGNGTVNRTTCVGNVVGLTAVPGTGASFVGWAGADTNNANLTTTVTMSTSKTVTATFTGGAVLDEKLYMPVIHR